MKIMEKKYYNDEAWSYGNLNRINQYNPEIRLKEIQNFLDKNDIYSRFKQHRKARKYSPIYVYKKESYSKLM